MFVQNLNQEQQVAFYKTTEILISCDGEITSEELNGSIEVMVYASTLISKIINI